MSQDVHKVRTFEHPGEGRKRAKSTPKGRQVDPTAAHEIELLLGTRPRQRDLLIEHLHLIQDTYHQISAAHLAALADEMKLSFAEVFETATFYAHFDIVKEGEPNVPPLTIRVCDSPDLRDARRRTAAAGTAERSRARHSRGARALRRPLRYGARCRSRAQLRGSRDRGERSRCGENGDTHAHLPDYVDFDAYVAGGGYQLLARLRSGVLPKEDLLKSLDDASLRGLGGAGFPTGRKWRSVLGEPGPRLMAVNGDEGEPGTFKDRYYLETDPHRFLEGMLIGAHVVEATDVYIYLRDEYPASRQILEHEIAKLPSGGPTIHLRRGAGAYICGEESSLLESLEGKRGLPRHKPPFPFQVGLFGLPTLINNIETLWWVRDIVEKGAEWWKGHGRNGRHRPALLFGVRSRQGSRHEARARRRHRSELIDEFCGGMADGHTFRRLPAGRRFRRDPAGRDGRHPARFRHAGEIRVLHRLGCGRSSCRPGRCVRRRRAESDAVLRR